MLFITYSLLAMSSEVPGVKRGPLAEALDGITDKKEREAAQGGGRGRRGGGRGGGRGGREASLGHDDAPLQSGGGGLPGRSVLAAASGSKGAQPDGSGAQDSEDYLGGGKRKPVKWTRGANNALERAAGELYAAGISVGSR